MSEKRKKPFDNGPLRLGKSLDQVHIAEASRARNRAILLVVGIGALITFGVDYLMFHFGQKATMLIHADFLIDMLVLYIIAWWAFTVPGVIGLLVLAAWIGWNAWVISHTGTAAPQPGVAERFVDEVQTQYNKFIKGDRDIEEEFEDGIEHLEDVIESVTE